MAFIRLQDKVPYVYVEESRDFQLLCRAFDVIFNGIKYDIDGMRKVINTHECKSTILQLLQTKLGFFTDKNFTDETIRYILEAFTTIVRKKGTREAIEEAVHLFLKINSLETMAKVTFITDTPTKEELREYGSYITDHCVLIGIESSVRDTTPLYEILKYIVPYGYNIFFYFFVGTEEKDIVGVEQSVKFIYVSNDINSPMLGSEPPTGRKDDGTPKTPDWDDQTKWFTEDIEKRRINAINSIEIVPQGFEQKEKAGVVVKDAYANTLKITEIDDEESEE